MVGISMDFLNRIINFPGAGYAIGWIVLLVVLHVPGAWAQLSPGELQRGHADLEGIQNCTRCHEKGQQLNPQNCLNCHAILADRIKKNQGLHSRPEYKPCGNCHIEHQGRTATLIFWPNGQDKFDHQLTSYQLQGKHALLECRSCHTGRYMKNLDQLRQQKIDPDRTFLGLTRKCLSCHRDEHRGQLQQECLQCHNMTGWKPVTDFDHTRTHFPLTGIHQQLSCEKCHQRMQDNKDSGDIDFLKFAGLEYDTCNRCHPDVHQTKFGTTCEKCHTTGGWKNVTLTEFNHDRTNFALHGRHALLSCKQCHLPGNPLKIPRYTRCTDCHRDFHQGQFVHRDQQGACEECHTVTGFSPANFTVDDHRQTAYPLAGAHLAVPCNLCHKKIINDSGDQSIQFKFESTTCPSCHLDIHQGTVDIYLDKISSRTGRQSCEYCHSLAGWKMVEFDHQQTSFTLTGKHLSLACSRCHQSILTGKLVEKILFTPVSQQCNDCHQDIHMGQFNADASGHILCQRCHTPESWQKLVFEHNRDSRFPLQGAHQTVPCNQCHLLIMENERKYVFFKPLDTSCKTCHGQRKVQNKIN